ncbi:ANE_G0013630.mRNA.1.CDS.1 [Saccharomyces cerevisiae]|nr:AVI_1a_G0013600.mRNA.1.CDS.1 [Saccharomyces cerevisiae]CAI4391839.1 ANE_G0013630.mRNA.1.CDS.1 [Saccharomyces cerevisiae]CAI6592824.1 ANE_G0013630.mRNA.1.CDS.1 [Saccharomyces cerevisiae]CAI7087187.1 AVI_1a_G0013600.mRNA.1.CDS.1 [Saccharomyces cerevisiae]
MREYTSKKELKEEIEKKYEKYDAEFETISESQKDEKVETVDRTPSENLSYQLGWVNLLLEWEEKEIAGYNVETPAPGYKWNNLGGLYQSFYKKYGIYSIKEQRAKLREAVTRSINGYLLYLMMSSFKREIENGLQLKLCGLCINGSISTRLLLSQTLEEKLENGRD